MSGALVTEAGRPLEVHAHAGSRQELVYYVWNTSDGRLIPSARGFAEAIAPIDLVWLEPGTYRPSWMAVGLSGWTSEPQPGQAVEVSGSAAEPDWLVPERAQAQALGQERMVAVGKRGALDWNGITVPGDFVPSSLVIDLPGLEPLDWLVIQPDAGAPLPRHFLIESAMAPGEPWQPVMSANFPFFPEPAGKAIWVPLRGLVAGALRIHAPRAAPAGESYRWSLDSVRVVRGKDAPFMPGGGQTGPFAFWNNLWLNFGIAANEVHQRFDPWWETDRPLDGGMVCIGSCEWLAWGAKKLSWLGRDHKQARRLEEYIAGNPVAEDGLAWASPGSAKHLGHSVHYVNNAIYPTAVARHYLLQREQAFLEKKDPKTGEPILSKARRALNYLLDDLDGREGMVVLSGEAHDGTPGSHGSNYWDFWLFGYQSAYTNAYFYEALRMVAELEDALGASERAEELRALRPLVKQRFNEAFWNEETGRYAGWVDVNGEVHDYGFTFVNATALAFGLAADERAGRVLSWLAGERVVAGDDSRGADIYHFGFGPRTNTVDARHGDPPPVNTWGGAFNLEPGGNAAFGRQIQNGGAIFYVSYYDLHARNRYRGAEAAMERANAIERGFHLDHLRRDPSNNEGVSDIVGVLREFPESGLVPYYFIDGIAGIEPIAEGLRVTPSLPASWPSAEVRGFHFAGEAYTIRVERGAEEAFVAGNLVTVPAGGKWLLTTEGKVMPHD